MKTIPLITCVIMAIFAINIAFAELPSEFISRNEDGSIRIKGIYTRNSSGQVIRYDVTDSEGTPLYSEIPYYAEDGRIIRGDRILPDGSLDKVVVFFENKLVILNASGEVIETQPYSEKEFLKLSPKQ